MLGIVRRRAMHVRDVQALSMFSGDFSDLAYTNDVLIVGADIVLVL